jgi:hypothetical protein
MIGDLSTSKKTLYIIILLWIIVQSALYINYGIYTEGEALRVIREARFLEEGKPFSSPIYFTYLTEILLTLADRVLNANHLLTYCTHLVLNLTALISFYLHLSSKINFNIAAIFSALLIICIPYQLYNNFVYTESIFFSLATIYTCLLLRSGKRSGGWLAITLLVLFLLCFTRPSGIFFLLATLLYGFYRARAMAWWGRLILLALALTPIVLLINYGMQTGGGINIMEPFLREHIICDAPQRNIPLDLNLKDNTSSLQGLLYYITHNFSHFLHLAWQKSIAFFGLQRTWYSGMHNALIALYFYPIYILILYRLFKNKFSNGLVWTLLLLIIHWGFVILSCDEWHSRFFLTLTPMLLISAAEVWKPARIKDSSID